MSSPGMAWQHEGKMNCEMFSSVMMRGFFLLKSLPTIIEMPYNDVVQKFVAGDSGKFRRSVSYMLGAGNF